MPTPTQDAPELTVEEAEAQKAELLERFAAGATDIDPLALLHADAAIQRAELVTDAVRLRREREAEEARLAAIDDLRRRCHAFTVEDVQAKAAAAIVAIRELVDAADELQHTDVAIARQLELLKPYPDDVDTGGTVRGRPIQHGKPRGFAGRKLWVRSNSETLGVTVAKAVLGQAVPDLRGAFGPEQHRTATLRPDDV